MKKFLLRTIRKFGYDVKRVDAAPLKPPPLALVAPNSMQAGLLRSKQWDVMPQTIVDVGAAEGTWTQQALNIWSRSNFLLFEPLEEREQELTNLASGYKSIHLVKAAAGREKSVIDFYVTGDLDGSGVADNGSNAQKRTIPVTTIDEELSTKHLSGPYLLKLDTHGYEVPIFEGALNALRETQLIVVECYGFQIAPQSLLFWEMCQYLDGKGFRLVDLVDVYGRPSDHAFWQCDAFFIPKNHPLFAKNTYH